LAEIQTAFTLLNSCLVRLGIDLGDEIAFLDHAAFRYGIAQKRALHLRLKRHIGDRDAIAKGLNGQGDTFRLGGRKGDGRRCRLL